MGVEVVGGGLHQRLDVVMMGVEVKGLRVALRP